MQERICIAIFSHVTNAAPFDVALERATRLVLPPAARRREIREAAGLSLRQVAEPLGVTAMTVHRWEQGGKPGDQLAERYGRLLIALEEAVARAAG